MYAIIRAGGKQYTVSAGDTVRVEKMEKKLGEQFDLPEVLMVGGEKSFVGAPLLQNAKVTVVVTRQAKAAKIIVFKKKRRQGYRRLAGHRQLFTELFVMSITTPEGQIANTEKTALVIDPVRTQERKATAAQKHSESNRLKKKARAATVVSEMEPASKKPVRKKATGAKGAAKVVSKTASSSGKKSAPKKKILKKKTAEKPGKAARKPE